MKTYKSIFTFSVLLSLIIVISACEPQTYSAYESEDEGPEITKAVAVMHATAGDSASGQVTFTKVDNGIKVEVNMIKLSPGKHGFHIHQWGDCSAPDGTSAGGHYDPTNKKHGAPGDEARHVGDLGNIEADSLGMVRTSMIDSVITLEGKNSIIGRGVIIHAGEDDLTSQPTGDAGGRVACGVIGIAAEKKNEEKKK